MLAGTKVSFRIVGNPEVVLVSDNRRETAFSENGPRRSRFGRQVSENPTYRPLSKVPKIPPGVRLFVKLKRETVPVIALSTVPELIDEPSCRYRRLGTIQS
jgi:hypothetical protein